MMYPRSFNYEVPAAEPNWAFYQQSVPGGRSSMDIYPRSSSGSYLSHGMYPQVPSDYTHDYTPDHMLDFPKATLSDYPGSHFREVKHVAPPAHSSSFGQPELPFWAPRGFSQPHTHVYSNQPLAVDEVGPLRYDTSLGGLTQPRSAEHAVDQSGFADAGFESEVVEPRGFRHFKKLRHYPDAWQILKVPAQQLYRGFHSLPFVQGKAHVKRM